jgi:hypothetical protein
MSRRFVSRTLVTLALSCAAVSVATPSMASPAIQAQQQQSQKISQTDVGPWAVIKWVAPNGVGYCSAERAVGDTAIAFVRFKEGYALVLRSPNWQLDPSGNYPVKFTVAFLPNSAQAQVLSPNLILVRLTTDPAAMRQIAGGQTFEVTAADTNISVPLDRFGDALVEMDKCIGATTEPAQQQSSPIQPPSTPGVPNKQLPDFKSGRVSMLVEQRTYA